MISIVQRRVAFGVTAIVGVHYAAVSYLDATQGDLRGPGRAALSAVAASSSASSVTQILDTTLNRAAYDAVPYRTLKSMAGSSV